MMLATLIAAPVRVRGQGLTSASSASLSVATLTEAQYDAGGPSGSTQSYTVTTSCTGAGGSGCRLFIQYGTNSQGQQVGTQWALTSATPASDCKSLPTLNVFADVVPTTVVLTTGKNNICVATFVLRVNPLAYTTYQSPGPVSGAYKQQVVFVLTRP
jgi:hypothetical protein